MNVLFVNACVREQSRTLLLARHLLSRLSAQVSEIRLEDMDMKPLTKHSLSQRDDLLRQGKWEDPPLCLARQFADVLSFLGWEILSVFTFGLLDVFYVRPYMEATFAELYLELKQ